MQSLKHIVQMVCSHGPLRTMGERVENLYLAERNYLISAEDFQTIESLLNELRLCVKAGESQANESTVIAGLELIGRFKPSPAVPAQTWESA